MGRSVSSLCVHAAPARFSAAARISKYAFGFMKFERAERNKARIAVSIEVADRKPGDREADHEVVPHRFNRGRPLAHLDSPPRPCFSLRIHRYREEKQCG